MTEIICPTVDIFLYDLIESLGASEQEKKNKRKYFKSKLPEDIQQELLISDNDVSVEYVHLLPNMYKTFASNSTYKGYYYPVQLGDTYGLLIECNFQQETEAKSPQCFEDLKKELDKNILKDKKGTIGQTLTIYGYLPPSSSTTPEQIEQVAKDCYEAVIPNLNWDEELDGKGEYLGATIFELSRDRLVKQKLQIEEKQEKETIQNNQHVIIIIYPDRQTLDDISGRFHSDWMRLFHYYHKMMWAYGQSRSIQKTIKTYFTDITNSSQFIEKKQDRKVNLKTLDRTLQAIQDTLNNYATDLNNLDFQQSTIEINLSNYEKRIAAIKEKSEQLSQRSSNLELFAEFTKLVEDKYLVQIKKDKENLERGFKLLENTINAVRSRIEVKKAESDRNFQELVTVVGAGIAVVSIVQRTTRQECKAFLNLDIVNNLSNYKSICEYPLLYSLAIALIVAILTWLIRRLWQR